MSGRRPLFLTGPMGSGKSTIGARAAAIAGVEFVDLDARTAELGGADVATLFARGEPFFREIERRALEAELANPAPRVVALGGGALLARSTRLRVLEAVTLVSLHANVDALARRVATGPTRPLLVVAGDDVHARLEAIVDARREGYAEAHAIVETTSASIDDSARACLAIAAAEPVAIAAGERSYAALVTRGPAALASVLARTPFTSALVISDANVEPLVRAELAAAFGDRPYRTHVIAPGEREKSLTAASRAWASAREFGLDRRGLVVGVGGGVVTDVAGFVAACWLRGVRWVSVPTTLLAMVDAGVGGKTGVDFGDAKNAVGAFHPPIAVVADRARLATEPPRGRRSGFAEVVKTALVGDAALFAALSSLPLEDAVRPAIAVKAAIVSRDPFEQNERAHLNLGHTLAHALEAASGYARFTHGEAVAIGLTFALRLGVLLGKTDVTVAERTEQLLTGAGLPIAPPTDLLEPALALLSRDKKRVGDEIGFVFVGRAGEPFVSRIAASELVTLARRVYERG